MNWVNGQAIRGSEKLIDVKDKYSGDIIESVNFLNEEETESCVNSSVKAFEAYRNFSVGQKGRLLENLIAVFEKEQEGFIRLIVKEAGKPVSYAKGEVSRCIATMKTGLRELYANSGEVVNMDFGAGSGKTAFTKRFPIGPVLAISPFNFPLNLALHKIIPALVAGCSIVIKPSPYAPLSTLRFAQLVSVAGYPPGVVNAILCSNNLSEKLVKDEQFKLLSFTGSAEIGWMLKSKAGKKKVTLELGGDAAVYIHADADLDLAAKLTAIGAFLYAGQICISTQKVIVHQDVYDTFKEKFLIEVENLKSGNPFFESVSIGPLIDKVHFERVISWINEAQNNGAKTLTKQDHISAANIIQATVLEDVSKNSIISNEEVFGPVCYLVKVENETAAFDRINDSKYGLQAGIFTNDLRISKHSFQSLEVGAVIINNVPGFRMDNMPYGGVKDSGIGREGLKYAIEDMTEMRLMVF
ncbi:aldehyde dehydrogenase family protein [Flavobacteriales bacterium]|jgi:glyceraldehyde-3-phosphate dehydrogenase (NADP+)|nr:aldehyde dehydrogenase family protein [Flavobacteriales bacterium]